MNDKFNLQRFVDAQRPLFEGVLRELYLGEKSGHWMWFIFPQIAGLGQTTTSVKFSISCKAEAIEYLDHQILGARLRQCTELVLKIEGRSVESIFGHIDGLKFHSSMTLFNQARMSEVLFKNALEKYFDGRLDKLTMDRL